MGVRRRQAGEHAFAKCCEVYRRPESRSAAGAGRSTPLELVVCVCDADGGTSVLTEVNRRSNTSKRPKNFPPPAGASGGACAGSAPEKYVRMHNGLTPTTVAEAGLTVCTRSHDAPDGTLGRLSMPDRRPYSLSGDARTHRKNTTDRDPSSHTPRPPAHIHHSRFYYGECTHLHTTRSSSRLIHDGSLLLCLYCMSTKLYVRKHALRVPAAVLAVAQAMTLAVRVSLPWGQLQPGNLPHPVRSGKRYGRALRLRRWCA